MNSYFFEKIKKIIKSLKEFIFSKKTLSFALLWFICYKYLKTPQKIETSAFLEKINSNSTTDKILSLKFLEFSTILIKTLKKDYYTIYSLVDRESFHKTLTSKNIKFDYLNGLETFSELPYMQIAWASFGLMYSSYDEIKYLLKKYKKNTIKPKILTDSELLHNYVANEDIKREIKILLDQLRNPEKYKINNIRLCRGILLYGKPGTGKTLLAKCLAKALDINFISTCASEYVDLYVGSGARKVREVFEFARTKTPSIIFIDELESIGMSRAQKAKDFQLHSEHYAALNQLLSEMDGMEGNENIVIIAATNRQDLLDSALVRPGRFDKKIELKKPDLKSRYHLFEINLKNYKYNNEEITNEIIKQYAEISQGFTGAIISGIVNDAATLCFSDNRTKIEFRDLHIAFDQARDEYAKFSDKYVQY